MELKEFLLKKPIFSEFHNLQLENMKGKIP